MNLNFMTAVSEEMDQLDLTDMLMAWKIATDKEGILIRPVYIWKPSGEAS